MKYHQRFQLTFYQRPTGFIQFVEKTEFCMDLDDLPAVDFDPDIRDNSAPAVSAELRHKKDACTDPWLMLLPKYLSTDNYP